MIYSGARRDGYLKVATAGKARGLKGHLRIMAHTDAPDSFHQLPGLCLWAQGEWHEYPIEEVQSATGDVFIKLAGVNSREAAEALRGQDFYVHEQNMPPLDDGAYYIADLVGCKVAGAQRQYGVLKQVMQHGAADVYELETPDGATMMFPALKRLLLSVDIKERLITVDDGIMEEVAVYAD